MIGNALRLYVLYDTNHKNWDEKIPEIANAINNSTHTTTGKTPFEINFGQRMPQHGTEYKNFLDANSTPSREAADFEKLRTKIQNRINESRAKYEKRYNLRTRNVEYKVGDIVYRENTILSDASKNIAKKLTRKRVKCEITGKTGTNTYLLKDLETGRIAAFHAQKFFK